MKSSINKKFLTLLLGSVAAASLLIGGAGIFAARNIVSDNSAQIMNLSCKNEAAKIDEVLTAIEQTVKTDYSYALGQLSRDDTLRHDKEYMRKYLANIRPILKNSAQNTDCAVSIYFHLSPEISGYTDQGIFLVNKHGNFVDVEATDLGLYSPEDTQHVGWYYQPIENGGPMWMDPYYNPNISVKMISYVIPVFIDNTVVGVIGMDIDLSLLVNTVKDIAVYETGYAFLACENGDIVYHRQYPVGISKADFDESLLNVGKAMGGEQYEGQIVSYEWYGDERRLVYSRLENGMYLIVSAPASEIDADRNLLILQCGVLLVIILGVSAILGVRLVKKLTRPLSELTEAAGKIAEGQWDVEIRSTSNDEVGVLANTLSDTIGELRKYIEYVNGIAYVDETTGVGNNRAFAKLTAETECSIQEKTARFSLVAMDFINLKRINDTYGSGKGDAVVITVSGIMRKIFGKNAVYRLSDEMFTALLENKDLKTAEELTDKFEAELEELNRKGNLCPEEIIVAAGAACYEPDNDTSFADVTTKAGKKLFNDKKQLAAKQSMLEDALKMLQMAFHKILKVNLTTDEYYEIKVYEEEHDPDKGYRKKFSDWMREFARSGQVAAESFDDFISFTDRKNLKSKLASGETYLSNCYLRKVGGEYRWVMMEIVKSVEYTDGEQLILLYVRDINDFYTAKLEYHRELERISNTDALTGLYNRHYMTGYFKNPERLRNIGIIFCDLNGLKFTNDNFGHSEGDKLIDSLAEIMKSSFLNDMCCRTGGDEFIICVVDKTEWEFNTLFNHFKAAVGGSGKPIASLGKCWRERTDDVDKMITEAENAMYEDKQKFYKAYPQYKR